VEDFSIDYINVYLNIEFFTDTESEYSLRTIDECSCTDLDSEGENLILLSFLDKNIF